MMKESISIDEICHKHNIGFIKADVCGVFASVFCDFGTGFQVLDVDGKHSSCVPFALNSWVFAVCYTKHLHHAYFVLICCMKWALNT